MTKWKYEYRTILDGENVIETLNEWGLEVVNTKEVRADDYKYSSETGMTIVHPKTDTLILLKMAATKETKITESDTELERSIILVVNRLNEVTKSEYTTTAKGTRKCIAARLNEGKTVKDFFDVIESRNAEWGGGDMAQYLRPQTLFGNKFEGYLNYARANKPKEPTNKAMDGMIM